MAEKRNESRTQANKRLWTYKATGKYYIEPVRIKDKTVYRLIRPDGQIANDYDHPTMGSAEKHKVNCEAFILRKYNDCTR